jgi:hypothetical protein
MKGRAGKSAIALFLCLIFLSTLLFIFLENKTVSTAQSLTSADPEALVELADPRAFIGVMDDYEYDLYRKDGDQFTFVPPPELDYADPASLDDVTLNELKVATDELPPATRETTITLTSICPDLPDQSCSTLMTGHALIVQIEITPATKTILIEGGTATQEVYILPSRVDLYVAVRTPAGDIVFLNRLSTMLHKYFRTPVVFRGNFAISVLKYPLFGILMPGNLDPGYYIVYCVMVPPGQNVFGGTNNWISNLATLEVPYNLVQ